jgi:uncharacterized protein DUF4157
MHDHERELRKPPPVHGQPTPPAREAPAPASAPRPAPAQRLAALDGATVLRLQRTAGNQGVVQMLAGDEERSPVHDVVGSGGGTPLDASTRGTMEAAFGRSFEDVRVHTDGQASQSAESVGANAYTVGRDMVFKSGHYDPGSAAGQKTIAHELSHVVQQSQGPVDGTAAPGGIRVSDPSDRFEQAADHRADQVMASVGSATRAPAAGGVQRDEDGSQPMRALQREAAIGEDEEGEEPVG